MSVPDHSSPRSPWLAFTALVSMQLMIVIDISIVTVALRSIQEDLGFPQARIGWVTTAYTIGFGGLLLLSGRLGDLIGRKRMFLTGLSVFTASSVLCGLSQTQTMLVAMRFIQGAGAAMAFAVAMGIIFTLFPDPRQLGKAMGAIGFAQAAGASVGVLAGGLISDGVSWHWVFFINVPIGITAGVLVARKVPNDRGMGLSEGADMVGAVLATAGLMLGVYTITTVDDFGWGTAHTIGFGLSSIALLVAFVVRQATAAKPLVPLSIFRSRNLSGANAVHLLMVAGMISSNILIALYLQQVAGYSASTTSFAFLPIAVAAGVVSLGLSARLNMRFGPRNVLLAALAFVTVSLLLAMRAPVEPTYVLDVLPTALLLGAGSGLGLPAVMTLAMSVDSPRNAGLASGLAGTSGMIGDALGIAIMTAIAAAEAGDLIAAGKNAPAALNGGFHLAFGVAAAVVAVAIVVGSAVLRTQPMGPPQQSEAPEPLVSSEGVSG